MIDPFTETSPTTMHDSEIVIIAVILLIIIGYVAAIVMKSSDKD